MKDLRDLNDSAIQRVKPKTLDNNTNGEVSAHQRGERILIQLMTSDRKLKASREGSK